MDKTENLSEYKDSYNSEFKFYNESLTYLDWYSKRMCEDIRVNKVQNILSLGIGHQIVIQNIANEINHNLKKHVILEGAIEVIKNFKEKNELPKQIETIHTYFEDFETNESFDAIEAGFVLEHVDDPSIIINHIKKFLKPDGKMYLAVPNALSLHRILGREAGLLDNCYKLSKEDLMAGHKRYFDLTSFTKLILDCELKITKIEGLLLKPFTTGQLNKLNLDSKIWEALLKVGVNYPEICNSIYMEVSK